MSLKALFAEREIVCAHVVDDAFDEVPSYAMRPEDAQHVLDIADDINFTAICKILNLAEADEDGVRQALQDVECVQKLFLCRQEISGDTARALFDPFDKDKEGKEKLVQPLVDLLRENGVTCHCFGNDYQPAKVDAPQILFVDLKLKEGPQDLPRHEDAVRVFRTLLQAHANCKPFVFLMSSLGTVLPEKRELFRRDAGLFQSEFEDVEKNVFTNGDELARILGSYTKSLELLGALRDKMKGFESGVESAATKVMNELRSLDLADYFVLYHNTTAVEKVNIGSYIVEMLLEYFAHEVEGQSQVWDLAKALDTLNVAELPRARFGVTPAAARLYSANMLHSSSMLLAEDEAGQGPTDGYFFTGDIFFDAQAMNLPIPEKAYAIITPACDLVRPDQLRGRSVVLCEGAVKDVDASTKLTAKDGLPLVVMPHPRDASRFIAIEWNKKKIHVWQDADRAKLADPAQCSFVRRGRLRPTYALQLQHAITADLSRVGTQKPPSALVPHRVRCLISDGKKWHEVYFDANADAAALAESELGDKKFITFILADPTIHKALVQANKWIDRNPEAASRKSVEKVLADEVRQVLRGYRQKVPQSKGGKAVDVTAYPLESIWQGDDQKLVAIARDRSASIYSQIADGHDVKGDQRACVVFRLEAPPEPVDEQEIVDDDAIKE